MKDYYIGIPEIQCFDRLEDTEGYSILYKAKASSQDKYCDKCNAHIKMHLMEKRERTIEDTKSEGKLVFIKLTVQRYVCPNCKATSTDEFTFVDAGRRVTNRLIKDMVLRHKNGESFSQIARYYSIDRKTVRGYCDIFYKDCINKYIMTPRTLGIDEAHINGEEFLVLTDLENRKLIDIKPDNSCETVSNVLKSMDSDICKKVVIDFCDKYVDCIYEALPNVQIIIDRFHVIKALNEAIEAVYLSILDKNREKNVDSTDLYDIKSGILSNEEELIEGKKEQINKRLKKYPDLEIAYKTKEKIRLLYQIEAGSKQIEKSFVKCIEELPQLTAFNYLKSRFLKFKESILNYWDNNVTNGFTEHVNNQIKCIYDKEKEKSFEKLYNQWLFEINCPLPEKFSLNKAHYESVATL